jgi:plastocyanin
MHGPERFKPKGRIAGNSADWVSLDMDRAVFGSGTQVTVAAARPTIRLQSQLVLDAPAVDGVLVGGDLFLVERYDRSERLSVLTLNSNSATTMPVRLHPQPRASLRLGQMDDYLLVAEDGYGLRILGLPGHRHNGSSHHDTGGRLAAVGFFPFSEKILAVTASLRTIYVATERELVVIDASVPALPGFVRRVPLDTEANGLAANGSKVYLLGDDGLRMLDLSGNDERSDATLHPGVRGQAILLAGRTVYVAGGELGLQEFQDQSAPAQTFFVQVGDAFFNPAGVINVNVGDMVVWEKPSTAFTHNVFSCNSAQTGCGGATSTETFTSGPVTTSPFDFFHTFNLVGSNPYLCQTHTLTMQGDITVAGGPAAPPGVSSGAGGSTPMTVDKLVAAGTDLSIAYDTSCTGAVDHDIIFGTRAQLPAALGGIYGLTGGRCSIGTTSPFTWTATPAPASGDFVWWVIVADDGSGTEGSWGKDGGSGERDGSGLNGASGQCANTDKDLSNTCGL